MYQMQDAILLGCRFAYVWAPWAYAARHLLCWYLLLPRPRLQSSSVRGSYWIQVSGAWPTRGTEGMRALSSTFQPAFKRMCGRQNKPVIFRRENTKILINIDIFFRKLEISQVFPVSDIESSANKLVLSDIGSFSNFSDCYSSPDSFQPYHLQVMLWVSWKLEMHPNSFYGVGVLDTVNMVPVALGPASLLLAGD